MQPTTRLALAATFAAGASAFAGVDILETFDGGTINTHNGTSVQWSDNSHPWHPGASGMLPGDHWGSASITHSQISSLLLQVEIDAGGGFLSLDYAVSSETGFDFFQVYVDVVKVFEDSGTLHAGNFGPHALTAGTHNIEFWYRKDISVSSGLDAAALDNVRVTNVVPAPSAVAIAGLGGLAARRRR